MKVLGVDYGSSRVGIAISDDLGIVAVPLEVVPAGPQLAQRISDIARENKVQLVVIGFPRNMDGSRGMLADEVEQLAEALKKRGFEVRLWDERLTTAQVERLLVGADVSRRKRKGVVDKLAACVMLQSFLDCMEGH